MPTLEIFPGLTLNYLDLNPAGRSAVLLLHGLGVSSNSWQMQVPALVEAGYRVLAPDAPGFGQSSYPGKKNGIAEMAADFAGLLRALATGPVYVAGISMGGAHALQLVLDHPELVSKLVLVNTFAHLRPAHLSGWLYFGSRAALVHTLGLKTQARLVAKHLFPAPEQAELRRMAIEQIVQASPQGYRAAMRALWRFDVRHRLGAVSIPTLVVTASGDRTVRPETQRALAQGIPNARQAIVHNAGHAVIIDQPQEFNRLLLNFFESVR